MSVGFEEKRSQATCKSCQRMAVDGTLERLDFNSNKADSYNNKGAPRFTDMQRKFASHPEVSTNAKKAALESGYSDSFAKSQAVALRKQLAPLIMQHQEAAKKISAISTARVQTELASMGFANVIDYFDIDPTSGRAMPKKLNELTREQAAAIQEVKLVEYETEDDDGYVTKEFRIGWLKLADKRANLVELGKTLGMFNTVQIDDKKEATLLLQEVPTDALEEAEALLMDAVNVARIQKSKNNAIEGECEELPQSNEDSK